MRILLANDGAGDAGGVQAYLDAVGAGLLRRGHALALVHRDGARGPEAGTAAMPQFSVADEGLDAALARVQAWRPDVVFSHNMNRLDVDRALAATAPVVKFMHGYFGTCIGGLKRHAFPAPRPCDRVFGPACAALYLPCRCGRLSVRALVEHYRWSLEQRAAFGAYRAIVVASEHMRREYVRNGVPAARVHANPLFPTHAEPAGPLPDRPWTVAFAGRMTALKGGDLLVRAAAEASSRLGRPIDLLMLGDGPARAAWEALADRLAVRARFTGWIDGDARWPLLREAHLLAVPSVWPEPFGLVGLEAAALGVPAIAFDVGGVREWLRPGVNGLLIDGDPPAAGTLARGLAAAFGDETMLLRMRGAARAVAAELSLDRHLDRLEPILRP